MPTASNRGVRLYYETEGSGEAVVFVEDLGYGAWMWGWQHAALAGPYEAVIWDNRGTGRSDAPPGPYTVEGMAADLEAVLADRGARRAHVVGAGLGGMIALRYVLDYERAKTLTLVGTSPGGPRAAVPSEPREQAYAPPNDRAALRESLRTVLSESFFEAQPEVIDGIVEWRASGDAERNGWEAQNAAVDGFDASDRLYEVTVPALVIHGTDDALFPVENARLLDEGLPKAESELIEDGPHLVFVERSRDVNDRLFAFLEDHAE